MAAPYFPPQTYDGTTHGDRRSTASLVKGKLDSHNFKKEDHAHTTYRPYEDSKYYSAPNRTSQYHGRPSQTHTRRNDRDWDEYDTASSEDDYDHRQQRAIVHRPQSRRESSRHSRRRDYDSDSESEDYYRRARSRGRHHRGRSTVSRSRHQSVSRSRPRDLIVARRPKETYTLTKAIKSAAAAACVEAFRCRAEPGPWSGQKAHRIAIAAVSGAAVGSLRNGRLQKSGKLPYAEAAMTGAYSVDFLKRVLRQTEFTKDAEKEQREWEVNEDSEDERRRYGRRRSMR